MRSFASSALTLALPLSVLAQSYTLKTTYQGEDFFGQWNFSTAVDRNYGFASFQNSAVASSQGLAKVASNGNVILKVDNTTVGQPADTTYGRASVYLESLEVVNMGSLVLFDSVHVPFGCSVWPAFFLQGPGVWPTGGEIDIFENVNKATGNQYSLHTYPAGCTHATNATESGTLVNNDCYNGTNSNQGCIIKESKPNSFGSGFNENGGGGFATTFDSNGIKMWFFPRSSLPSDWTSSSPNPANWGEPSAYYPASSCDPTKFFGPQTMVLDIDICGSYAGGAFSETCPGSCVDLLKTPTNYDDAYFEIAFIKVFTEGGSGNATATTSSTARTSSPTKAKTGGTARKNGVDISWVLGAVVMSCSMFFGGLLLVST